MKQEYWVENLKCEGCVHSVKNALLKIDGVVDISVDVESGLITVNGAPDENSIREKLNELGYPEIGHNTFAKKAKSYVSCAIGKITK